jgi:hypothetical protein
MSERSLVVLAKEPIVQDETQTSRFLLPKLTRYPEGASYFGVNDALVTQCIEADGR